MNIRVDLNTPIKDGTEVVFRSPVDCSQVTGLKVYYPGADGNTTSQEFVLADAHGNNVGDIDHLFAENVAVKVILDVTTGMAFVQNADTNAYLEGRFNGIIDTLCPSFTESGSVAACEPVEGYPLEVISTFDSRSALNNMKLTRCGKNLFDFKKGVEEIHFKAPSGADTMKYGYAIHLPAGTYTIHAEAISSVDQQFVFCYGNDADGNYIDLKECLQGNNVDATWLRQGGNLRPRVFAFDRNVVFYVYQGGSATLSSAQRALVDEHNIQIEAGSVATAYEPYQGQTFIADLSNNPVTEGSYNWTTGVLMDDGGTRFQHDLETNTFTNVDDEIDSEGYIQPIVRNILAQSGLNYLYSNCGTTQVKGKSDPVKIIEKLTNAVTALLEG